MSLVLFLKVFALVMFVLAALNVKGHPWLNFGWAGVAAAFWVLAFA